MVSCLIFFSVHKITVEQLLAPNPVSLIDSDEESEIEVLKKEVTKVKEIKSVIDSDELERLRVERAERLKRVTELKAPPSALNEVSVKRKRKRVRKRKSKEFKNNGMGPNDQKPSTSKQGGHLKPTAVWSNDTKNVHVRFTDNASSSSSSMSSESESDVQPVKVCKFIDETSVCPRKVQPITRIWDSKTQSYRQSDDEEPLRQEQPSEPVEINTEPDRTPSRTPNLRLDIPPNITATIIGPKLPTNSNATDHLSEAEVPSVAPVQTPTTTLPAGPNSESLEVLRKEIASLNLPIVENTNLKVSDTIAFKILRMDDQCQPTISDYIIGCIEKFDARRNEMTLRLLAGKSEIGSRICTTVITEENEIGVFEQDHIEVNFKELYEPRYCLFSV